MFGFKKAGVDITKALLQKVDNKKARYATYKISTLLLVSHYYIN